MKRDIDWFLILTRLRAETEETIKTIAKKLDAGESTIRSILNDTRNVPEKWNQAAELLDLYLEYFEPKEVPRVGDYYDEPE